MTRTVDIKISGIKEVKADIIAKVEKVSRTFITLVFVKLRDTTPVDTGTARATWQVVKKGGVPYDVPYGPHRTPTIPVIPHGDVSIMSSSPYMKYLNAGHSTKAPSRFIEKAVDRAVAEASK